MKLILKFNRDTVNDFIPLTIVGPHEVMEELWTVDHHNLTNTGCLPAGQVVPHPRTH